MRCPHCQHETEPNLWISVTNASGLVLARGEHRIDPNRLPIKQLSGGWHAMAPVDSILARILGQDLIIEATIRGSSAQKD